MLHILKKIKGGSFFMLSQLSEVIIFAFIYWALELIEPGKNFANMNCTKDDSNCHTLIKCFYMSLMIQSTLGYGDITPKTEKGRLINMIQIIMLYIGIAGSGILSVFT